jgi:ATP-dependent DNA helicase RecQ
MQRARTILKNTFGYDSFRHHQADIIQALLNGDDALVLMPTGGGKSLCYQIPAMIRDGVGIVISPLIALMKDQVEALKQSGVNAAYLNSTLDPQSQLQIEQQLLRGEIELLYVAPERLLTGRLLNLLQNINIALFAIDEAHCVSQWGHDFRRDYQQLSILHEHFPRIPRIALTATADERTRDEIIAQLRLHDADVFINSFDRPNIRYIITEGQNNRDRLWRFIEQEHPNDAGIVYCLSRKNVESVADWLSDRGRIALPYHAGLSAQQRDENQQRFLLEDGVIIVATIAFGMGIDKPDVRFVAHLNLPKSIEAYYQETGRAGRDGKAADAWLAYGLQDVITLRQMTLDSDADETYKRVVHHKLEAMLGLCEQTGCRRQTLLGYFGEPLAKPCGNCDTCLNPPETVDATEISQKALSCVYRSGQRFGVNYVIDVLTGKDDDRIRQFGHDKLSTFGIGTELNGVEWRGVFRQLIALGYLEADVEAYGALKLAAKARPLLRGETRLQLRKQTRSQQTKQKKSAQRSTLRSIDQPLFDALREHRMQLAREAGVPPYVIFHDKTLEEMARVRPQDGEQMRYISGVGESKLNKFGKSFLEIIAAHPLPGILNNRLSDTVNESLLLFSQGHDIEEIARRREIIPSTVYAHLAEAIEAGLVDVRDVLQLDDDQLTEITNALEMFGNEDENRLKPAYEALDAAYDYGVLRCVKASL